MYSMESLLVTNEGMLPLLDELVVEGDSEEKHEISDTKRLNS